MIAKRVSLNAGSIARCARRPVPRSVNARVRTQAQNPRFQSTEVSSSSSASSGGGGSSAAIGGVAGSLATFGIGYIWYRQSGAREIVNATKTTKDYVSSASKKLKDSTPEPNEALDWLRNAAKSYAVFVPGVGGYIDTAFDDLDAIREKHGDEVDDIVREAYSELQDLARNGQLSILTAQKAWNMDNHPQLREKVGGNIDKLKEYGENYGPEVRGAGSTP
jgi:hypothetical protein